MVALPFLRSDCSVVVVVVVVAGYMPVFKAAVTVRECRVTLTVYPVSGHCVRVLVRVWDGVLILGGYISSPLDRVPAHRRGAYQCRQPFPIH